MAEPLHLPPDEGPDTEDVRLGDQTYQVDRDAARAFRDTVESLSAQYTAQLEDMRRQILQQVGTPQQYYQPPQPQPEPFSVPNPDILFQNKDAWTEEFNRGLYGQLGQLRQENIQQTQGALQAVQAELNRRDMMQAAKATHDAAMSDMLERRGLTENTMLVQAVYNQQFEKLRNLPLELALDKIGAIAQEEIERIRAGENWTLRPVQGTGGGEQQAPAPPRQFLGNRRRAVRSAPPPAAEQELLSPGGGLGPMGTIIRKRQQALMGGSA